MRERAAIACMAVGFAALIVGVVLLAGAALGLVVAGGLLMALAVLLGWDR